MESIAVPGLRQSRRRDRKSAGGPALITLALFLSLLMLSGCTLGRIPQNIRDSEATRAAEYPWTAEPISDESQTRICDALQMPASDPFCHPGAGPSMSELMRLLEKRFPTNKTSYREVAALLKDFPSVVEESTSPEGKVTGRRYAYLLTQFQGFCVYFYVDLDTDLLDGIGNTKAPGIFDGPIPDVCGPAMR